MTKSVMTMAVAVAVALGASFVYGDSMTTMVRAPTLAQETKSTGSITMTGNSTALMPLTSTRMRPITTKLTTMYGTEVVIVSTTGTPVLTTTIAGATPGPTGKNNGPIHGVNRCEQSNRGIYHQFHIVATDADIYNDPNKYCGSGFLANFRGECRIISDWGCGCTDGRAWPCQDIWMTFGTDVFCNGEHIRAAFHKATSGNIQMDC